MAIDAASVSSATATATATAQVLTPSDEQTHVLARGDGKDGKDNKKPAANTDTNSNSNPNSNLFHDSPNPSAPWFRQVNWLNVVLIVLVPLYGCLQAFWVPLQTKTALWAVIYYFMTGLGITAGTSYSSLPNERMLP